MADPGIEATLAAILGMGVEPDDEAVVLASMLEEDDDYAMFSDNSDLDTDGSNGNDGENDEDNKDGEDGAFAQCN